MLERAERLRLDATLEVPVVHIEDLIGLKVQAITNDPSRTVGDWNDIRQLLEAAGTQRVTVDWELLEDYLQLFNLGAKLSELKAIYGAAQ